MYKTIKTRAGTWTVVGPGYGDLGLLPSVVIDMGRDMSGHRATATGGRYAFHETAERAVEYGPIWDRREDAERCAAAMQRAYDAAKAEKA